MRQIEERLLECWQRAAAVKDRRMPVDFFFEILDDPTFAEHYQIDPNHSWLLAAKEAAIPVYVPGWEDSTIGNMFTANVMMGHLPNHLSVKTGTEQFQALMEWYQSEHNSSASASIGFFQIGGGIAGDFAICAVPCIVQDLKHEVPCWSYLCQITDAQPSFGGYSGAPANEKITWGKIDSDTPRFEINSDASIVAPLIFAWVLGD
tara:strand:- start:704 stop:1318 length:615 start_codon:yes stop_codon:yes gene_type:complete